jgi:hypothetical protein
VEPSDAQSQLADALKRAFDSYLAGVTPPLPGSAGRRSRSGRRPESGFARIPEFRLTALIRGELGSYPGSGDAQAGEGTGQVRPETPERERRSFDGLAVHRMVELLAAEGPQPDTLAVPRRVARSMTGPPRPLWQYIAVSVAPAFPLAVFGGWELAPIDLVRDGELPLGYGYVHSPYSPGAFHLEHGYGALRHPSGEGDVPDQASESDKPVLTLPLLALNLASDHPVHAGVSYYVEPGRDIALRPGVKPESADFCSHPRELHKWDDAGPRQVRPRRSRRLDAEATGQLARFAPELGSRLLRLDGRRRERLIRAADQYLIVAHRTPGSVGAAAAVPVMHEPEAAFRWISAVEGLLAADDGDRSDLTRKTAQRAAVLIGQDDDERLATRELVRHAYAARSAYAHGGSPKSVDLAVLRTVTRKIIVAWTVLSADAPGRAVSTVLDDALLSARTLDEAVRLPLRRFWEHAW